MRKFSQQFLDNKNYPVFVVSISRSFFLEQKLFQIPFLVTLALWLSPWQPKKLSWALLS